ncbi:MAG: SCO family protein [Betaproteobacteria bacterium]
MKNQKKWMLLIATLLAILLWLAFFWEPQATLDKGMGAALSSSPAADTTAKTSFTLNSPAGPVSLSDYRGKVVLIYFGYTFCPDVCPTSLAALAQALSALTPKELEQVQGVFISVDPERDSMEVLKIYVPYFHPSLLGLSGSTEQVAQVARQYGARYMKQKPNADGLYSVDHSSFTYVVAPDGKLAARLPHGTSPQQIVDKIRPLLKP